MLSIQLYLHDAKGRYGFATFIKEDIGWHVYYDQIRKPVNIRKEILKGNTYLDGLNIVTSKRGTVEGNKILKLLKFKTLEGALGDLYWRKKNGL